MKHLSESLKWKIKWIGGILIFIIVWFGYHYQQKEKYCLTKMSYLNIGRPYSGEVIMGYRLYNGTLTGKDFPTQKEAKDYCMKTMDIEN